MNTTSTLSNGWALIPAVLREQLGLRDGEQLIWEVRDGELVATTRRTQLRRAQLRFQQSVPKGSASLTDELNAERRAAAASE